MISANSVFEVSPQKGQYVYSVIHHGVIKAIMIQRVNRLINIITLMSEASYLIQAYLDVLYIVRFIRKLHQDMMNTQTQLRYELKSTASIVLHLPPENYMKNHNRTKINKCFQVPTCNGATDSCINRFINRGVNIFPVI